MYSLYNIIVSIAQLPLGAIGLFNKKIKLFVDGRKNTFDILNANLKKGDKTIWIHCASLGEFEQGRPIIEKLKQRYRSHKIVLTFYSPSGYEVQKDYALADVVCYLPIDTKSNSTRFIDIVNPEMAIFVKYEFWPNILKVLKERKIETILVSGIFRKEQAFFKSFGGWMRASLSVISHFFVQDETSASLLKGIGINCVTVSGDTRFDRVFEITKQDNTLDFITDFKQNKLTIVAGSTWAFGEDLLVDFINNKLSLDVKVIIAPHNIIAKDIQELKNSIQKKVVLFSEKENSDLSTAQVFIIDTIGILTKVYKAADIAYVGGGYVKGGLHNTLEPATFGVPIIIGPEYDRFIEAVALVENGGVVSISNKQEFDGELQELIEDDEYRNCKGKIASDFVIKNTGATDKILSYIALKIKSN